jgi:hypothetical protein
VVFSSKQSTVHPKYGPDSDFDAIRDRLWSFDQNVQNGIKELFFSSFDFPVLIFRFQKNLSIMAKWAYKIRSAN